MKIYIFGNGNTSFAHFHEHYVRVLEPYLLDERVSFLVGDFRGVDTLAMELLKCVSSRVTVYHVRDRARYLPDTFRTKVGEWTIVGGFKTDEARDLAAIDNCTHYVAVDFNSDAKRKSGTLKNIERCEQRGKIRLTHS